MSRSKIPIILFLSADKGGSSYSDADRVIIANKEVIKEAAGKFGVDPNIVAGCIYTEQNSNYNIIDVLTDLPLFFMDTSLGIGQVKVSTAVLLAELGYVDVVGNGASQNLEIAYRLHTDSEYNIYCVAAYLSLHQSQWAETYDISNNPAILGSLYNLGEKTPHTNPVPNPFGEDVASCYWYMELLLY